MNQELTSLTKSSVKSFFDALDIDNTGEISESEIWNRLSELGINNSDPRLSKINKALSELNNKIRLSDFESLINNSVFLSKALNLDLVIPDFKSLINEIDSIYNNTKANKAGVVADYIPQLARVNPDHFAFSYIQ